MLNANSFLHKPHPTWSIVSSLFNVCSCLKLLQTISNKKVKNRALDWISFSVLPNVLIKILHFTCSFECGATCQELLIYLNLICSYFFYFLKISFSCLEVIYLSGIRCKTWNTLIFKIPEYRIVFKRTFKSYYLTWPE